MKALLLALALIPTLVVQGRSLWQKDVNWDVLIFTQQWPITSCIGHLDHHIPNAHCNLFPNMTSWTVHGIWPTKFGTIGPGYCNNSWPFDESQIAGIENYLIKYWGNMYAEESMTSLWQHEWTKHGTCAAQLLPLNSELKYFSKGLEWVTRYDYVAILGMHNIYPHDVKTYSRDQIFLAVKDTFGVNPHIDCSYHKEAKQHLLSQIKICFDLQLRIVDCDGIKKYWGMKNQGSCPVNGIVYPASVRTGGKEYSYPPDLVDLHKESWEVSQRTCNTWMCHALMTIFSLMWFTL